VIGASWVQALQTLVDSEEPQQTRGLTGILEIVLGSRPKSAGPRGITVACVHVEPGTTFFTGVAATTSPIGGLVWARFGRVRENTALRVQRADGIRIRQFSPRPYPTHGPPRPADGTGTAGVAIFHVSRTRHHSTSVRYGPWRPLHRPTWRVCMTAPLP